MTKRRIGRSDIAIEPFVLGTNVFGWTADEPTSFAVLDAFVAEGFSAVDTADVYSRWVPGNDSESEKIIGRWMKARGNREKIMLATKVGSDMGQGRKDLRATWIIKAVEGSLLRLQTDYIDLYQSHWPDAQTPEEETLGAYDRLIKAGKVRIIGASNYDEKLLANSLDLSEKKELPRYQCIQNEFNLYTRDKYEGAVQELVIKEGLSAITYFSLASGFLTGKYRSKADLSKSKRGSGVEKYLDARGYRLLAALDEVATRIGATPAEISLAWINATPGVAGPISSATSVAQLECLARGARLVLSPEDVQILTKAGK
jgi:aryl-alcohol dehydrogenase-like predicted oxidoreductase